MIIDGHKSYYLGRSYKETFAEGQNVAMNRFTRPRSHTSTNYTLEKQTSL